VTHYGAPHALCGAAHHEPAEAKAMTVLLDLLVERRAYHYAYPNHYVWNDGVVGCQR
jgi:hypothetical protein